MSVALQKAILVKSWERVEGKRIYGRPYRGDRESDWSEPTPAVFHRFMEGELFEQGRPFIVDKDPGVPVWNTPVTEAVTRIAKDPIEDGVLQVHTWLKGVDPLFRDPNEVGSHVRWIELRYQFFVQEISPGNYRVLGSEWLRDDTLGVDSVEFHPDFLVGLPPRGLPVGHSSHNVGLSPELVEQFKRAALLEPRNP
jgi:hypothetical protein